VHIDKPGSHDLSTQVNGTGRLRREPFPQFFYSAIHQKAVTLFIPARDGIDPSTPLKKELHESSFFLNQFMDESR
jgi:hypothetical protein